MNYSSSPKPTARPLAPTNRLELPDALGFPSLHVDMEAFFEFSFWIAEELEDLVAERKHQAAMRARVAGPRDHLKPKSKAR